jgi:hypothetical protein
MSEQHQQENDLSLRSTGITWVDKAEENEKLEALQRSKLLKQKKGEKLSVQFSF